MPVVEAFDAEDVRDHHDKWLGQPEVQKQMREVMSLPTTAV